MEFSVSILLALGAYAMLLGTMDGAGWLRRQGLLCPLVLYCAVLGVSRPGLAARILRTRGPKKDEWLGVAAMYTLTGASLDVFRRVIAFLPDIHAPRTIDDPLTVPTITVSSLLLMVMIAAVMSRWDRSHRVGTVLVVIVATLLVLALNTGPAITG